MPDYTMLMDYLNRTGLINTPGAPPMASPMAPPAPMPNPQLQPEAQAFQAGRSLDEMAQLANYQAQQQQMAQQLAEARQRAAMPAPMPDPSLQIEAQMAPVMITEQDKMADLQRSMAEARAFREQKMAEAAATFKAQAEEMGRRQAELYGGHPSHPSVVGDITSITPNPLAENVAALNKQSKKRKAESAKARAKYEEGVAKYLGQAPGVRTVQGTPSAEAQAATETSGKARRQQGRLREAQANLRVESARRGVSPAQLAAENAIVGGPDVGASRSWMAYRPTLPEGVSAPSLLALLMGGPDYAAAMRMYEPDVMELQREMAKYGIGAEVLARSPEGASIGWARDWMGSGSRDSLYGLNAANQIAASLRNRNPDMTPDQFMTDPAVQDAMNRGVSWTTMMSAYDGAFRSRRPKLPPPPPLPPGKEPREGSVTGNPDLNVF